MTCTPGPIRDCFLSNLHSTHADITPTPTRTCTHTHTHTHSDNAFNGSSTLAVVAAELTLDSLRGFVRQALPLCEGSSQVSCSIIDDLGSIIYDEVVVHSGMYRGGALFLERPFQNNRLDAIRVLFTSLQGNLVTKRECEDYFVVGVETRRFYSVSDCPLVINTLYSGTYCPGTAYTCSYIYVLLSSSVGVHACVS